MPSLKKEHQILRDANPIVLPEPKENRKTFNPKLLEQVKSRKALPVSLFVEKILAGDRFFLSRAITLVESQNPLQQAKAQEILNACLPHSGKSIRIGITGSPGVGKSTFIEAFGLYLIEKGFKVGVLAIDPSSPISKGSILGDKTRMEGLSNVENAFIRPSPTSNTLGGVAQKTRESILLCEAAGYDIILLETVGVGQSEVSARAMTDFFLLLLLPGAGDELQGIKRGIVELADLLVINKAEEDRLANARITRSAYSNALHLYPPKVKGWSPKVVLASALKKTGLENIWENIQAYSKTTKENGYFLKNRKDQALFWLNDTIAEKLKTQFYKNQDIQALLPSLQEAVSNEELNPFQAAQQLIEVFLKKQE